MKTFFKLEGDYMSRSEFYNTKQKDIILRVIKEQQHEFTIKEIYNNLKHVAGLTTIYRFVDKLVEDGRLDKYIGKDNTTYYHYLEKCDEHNHFYLKCELCGDMIHIDCDCIEDLSNHIMKNHKFKLNKEHIIINGFCEKCVRKCE